MASLATGSTGGAVEKASLPLANSLCRPYPYAMAIYTPPDIAGGLKDFWHYIRQDRPHRWPALGLAITVPGIILYGMVKSTAPDPEKRSIVYFESWPADRSEFDVRRDWLRRGIDQNEQNRRRRHAYGAIGNAIGQTYDPSVADREFDAARRVMEQALADLEAAEAAGRPLPPLSEAAGPQDAGEPPEPAK